MRHSGFLTGIIGLLAVLILIYGNHYHYAIFVNIVMIIAKVIGVLSVLIFFGLLFYSSWHENRNKKIK